MDGKLSQTKLSSLKNLLSIFDLASCFLYQILVLANHVLCSLETKTSSHLISYPILFLKLHTGHQVLRVPNLVTKL